MRQRSLLYSLSVLGICLFFSACSKKEHIAEPQQQAAITESAEANHNMEGTVEKDDAAEMHIHSKEEVQNLREHVLEGMTDEEIERLTENIKVANLRLEAAYLNDNIFDKLSDKDSLYWNYFDKKGDIQIGWTYDGTYSEMKSIREKEGISQKEFYEKYGAPVVAYNRFDAANFISLIQDMQRTYSEMKSIREKEGISQKEFYEKYGAPVVAYNRFDAANFISLIQDMQKSVHNDMLTADLQQLIDLTILAQETHEMEYANQIYKILHDLDYFLLRYGIEDVGKYTKDGSTVATYYGVLAVYGATPFEADL